jgi:hypothetical protein
MKFKKTLVTALAGIVLAAPPVAYHLGKKAERQNCEEQHKDDFVSLRFFGASYENGTFSFDRDFFLEIESYIGGTGFVNHENLANLTKGYLLSLTDSALTKRAQNLTEGFGFKVEAIKRGGGSYCLTFLREERK